MVHNNFDEEIEESIDDEDIDSEEIEELTDEELAALDDDDLEDIGDLDAITGNLLQAAPLTRMPQGGISDDVTASESDVADSSKVINEDQSGNKSEDKPEDQSGNKSEDKSEDQAKKKVMSQQTTLDALASTFKPVPDNFIIPKDLCWHVKRTKTGLTIPKEIRAVIPEEQHFAMVVKDNQIIFYYVNEEDIPKLNLAKKPAESKKKGKGGRKKRSLKKKPVGPQPEWGNYFLFEFENQEKIQEVLSTAFLKYASNPPDLDEGMKRVKFVLTNFMANKRMNDFRVRQAVVFFICDVIVKFTQPDLIDFIIEKIQPDIKSKFLKQLCLNELIFTCFSVKRYEKAQELISEVLEAISKSSEDYAITDSFKNLVVKITRSVNFQIPQEYTIPIKDSLVSYFDQMGDFDYKIQIVENLQRLKFIDDALILAKKMKASLPEDTSPETINEMIKSLNEKSLI